MNAVYENNDTRNFKNANNELMPSTNTTAAPIYL